MNIGINSVKDIKVAYIGGGSRGWAWKFMADLALEPTMSGDIYLYDIDEKASKNNEIIGNIITNKSSIGKWKYKSVNNIEVALKDANFVIISILPGTFDEMYSDVHEPEKLGVYQSVGDTTGPGGIIRALRTIPLYVEFAKLIEKICPSAWVINYTNPMTLCVKTLYETFPRIKAIGCCHEVFGTQKLLAQMCKEFLGVKEINRNEINVKVMGINHFTWLKEASYKGQDLFPMYKKFVDTYYESGYEEEDKNWLNSHFDSANRVKFDLFKKYGYIAAAGDRHLAEFMPNTEYLKDEDTIKSWMFSLTTVDWRKKDLQVRLEKSRKLANGEDEVDLEASGEEGVLIMKALLGIKPLLSNVIMRNTGQISNLSIGTIVETNAYFSKDKIETVDVGAIPEKVLELIVPHIEVINYVYEAAIKQDKNIVVKAFLADPMFNSKCKDEEKTKNLVEVMLGNTKKYLPKEWKI
ncbi:MAG: alpha-glucosidase/alpha-galactosidase [Lachnospirales bacterium]